MVQWNAKVPRVVQLADQIEADIRRRQLKPGDPYLNTSETAQMLRVSTSAANRALQLLAQRSVLERRQRKGAFISKKYTATSPTTLKRVHILVPQSYMRNEGLLGDGVLVGIQGELPDAELQFNHLPRGADSTYVSNFLSEIMRSNSTPKGLVLVRSSLASQRLVAGSGLPAVIYGTPYPSILNLPWVDRDAATAGRLLTQDLLDHGYKRILVLMRSQQFPGDHSFMDEIRNTGSQAGLAPDELVLRFLPPDPEAIRHETAAILQNAGNTFGIICKSEPLYDGAVQAIHSLGLEPQKDVRLNVCDVYRKPSERPPDFPCLHAETPTDAIGQILGEMLARQAAGERVHPESRIVPVELRIPPRLRFANGKSFP